MKYRSTRGHPTLLSFEEAVLQGLAPDGGLYIPLEIPKFTLQQIAAWSNLSFADLAFELYRPFISSLEIPDEDLKLLTRKSFSTFSHKQVTPIQKLPNVKPHANANLGNLWVLELFHGPTFAFKDVALQFLGNLFEYFLKRKNALSQKKSFITVVGATSGDTGGAAIYGLRGKENIQVFILHPHKRISPVQELQMTSVLDSNVHNIALEGSFDDCQDIVKALFSDAAFKEEYQLGAINSINWARILAQTTYYFFSYFSLLKELEVPVDVSSYHAMHKVQFSVPSGNFGDVLAGFFAKQMGLPVHKFIVATNENDILDRFLKTGRYDKQPVSSGLDPVKQTLSPAMDILISSNFERLLWYLIQSPTQKEIFNTSSEQDAERSCATIKEFMDSLKEKSGFSVNETIVALANTLFTSHRVNDPDTLDAMKRYYHNQFTIHDGSENIMYVLDPHTAVGVVAAETILEKQQGQGVIHTICLSTASPGKFPDAVLTAINKNPPQESIQQGFKPIEYRDIAPKILFDLTGRPQRMTLISTQNNKQKGLDGVRTAIVETLRPFGVSRL